MVSQREATFSELRLQHLLVSTPHDGVCHVQLDRRPVNALNTAVWSELLLTLDYVENNLFPKTVRVMVISSNARGSLFSAGNDLTELHVPSTTKQRFTKFWRASTTFLSRLYRSPLYTIAAIRGATPAGGCVMSLCCDYRIALKNTSMGLNEVAIGLSVPSYWARLLVRTINTRARGEEMMASGEMIPADTAYRLGLIDTIVQVGGREELVQQALVMAEKWACQKDVYGRVDTKMSLRKDFANSWADFTEDEIRKAWRQLSEPKTIATLGAIMKRLSQKQKAKM